MDKPTIEKIERSEHALCARDAVLDAEFGRTLSIDVSVIEPRSQRSQQDSAAGHGHGNQQNSLSRPVVGVSNTKGVSSSNAPIIILPSALTSPVTLGNIKSFLEKGVWVDPQTTTSNHSSHVEVTHEIRAADAVVATHSVKVPFCVVDSPAKLRPADWFVFLFCFY